MILQYLWFQSYNFELMTENLQLSWPFSKYVILFSAFFPSRMSCIFSSLQMAELVDSSMFEDENSKFLYPVFKR